MSEEDTMASNQMEDFDIPRTEEGFVSPLKSADESELHNSYFLGEGNVLTDSGSFFTQVQTLYNRKVHSNFVTSDIFYLLQLDSMIEAVKVESTALDSMRDKLKEVDSLRSQIAIFNKRLIDADQANLNLKTMLVKSQESFADLKQQKTHLEVQNSQLRAELNRTKDNYQKEKMARQTVQTEISSLRDQLHKFEKSNEQYEREVKAISALQESNELLKNDLAHVRRKFREEKAQMTNYIKSLEAQHVSTDALRADVRGMAMRLLEVSNVNTSSPLLLSSQYNNSSTLQQQQQSQSRSSYNSNASYQSGSGQFYNEKDDENDDIIGSSYEAAVEDDDLDINSYIGDESISDSNYSKGGTGSLDSSFVRRPPPQPQQRTVVMGQAHHNNQASLLIQQEMQQVAVVRNGSVGSGKKKKKKASTVVVRQQGSVSLPRLMN